MKAKLKPSGKTVKEKRKVAKKPAGTKNSKPHSNLKPARTVKTKKVSGKAKHANKASLKDRKIHEIRENLLMQRKTLLAEAEAALNLLPGQTIFPDLGDQASAEIDRNFMLRLREREQRLLKKIDAAINKIDKGIFGVCEVCGQEIGLKRLEARPVTTMCIACKTEQEEEEKLRRHGEY